MGREIRWKAERIVRERWKLKLLEKFPLWIRYPIRLKGGYSRFFETALNKFHILKFCSDLFFLESSSEINSRGLIIGMTWCFLRFDLHSHHCKLFFDFFLPFIQLRSSLVSIDTKKNIAHLVMDVVCY